MIEWAIKSLHLPYSDGLTLINKLTFLVIIFALVGACRTVTRGKTGLKYEERGALQGSSIQSSPGVVVPSTQGVTWNRHTIDSEGEGADGVRILDVNNDQLMDIATAWEEADFSRVYLNPGRDKVKQPWPKVTVGRHLGNPEDTALSDFNDDRVVDVISVSESGKTHVHWAPASAQDYLDEKSWSTDEVADVGSSTLTSIAADLDADGKNEVIIGTKSGKIFWLSPEIKDSNSSGWKPHLIEFEVVDLDPQMREPRFKDGWPMNLWSSDVNLDSKKDIIFTLRKAGTDLLAWAENPGPDAIKSDKPWKLHIIDLYDDEPQLGEFLDFDGDLDPEIVIPMRDDKMVHIYKKSVRSNPPTWDKVESIDLRQFEGFSEEKLGWLKAVTVANLDDDSQSELIFTTVTAPESLPDQNGVFYLKKAANGWQPITISGVQPTKFDIVKAIDVDQDGDMDIVTCEEISLNEVFWYENPLN